MLKINSHILVDCQAAYQIFPYKGKLKALSYHTENISHQPGILESKMSLLVSQADTHSTTFFPFCWWFGQLAFPHPPVPKDAGVAGTGTASVALAARGLLCGACASSEGPGPNATTLAMRH